MLSRGSASAIIKSRAFYNSFPHRGQGYSIEEAKDNLKEAIELFLEFTSPSEIENRLKSNK